MGMRVLKTALAVILSIVLARLMGLEYALSAGLLAIMGVDVTIRRSIRTVVGRIAACVTGLVFASFIFYIWGFHIWTIAVFILVVYPVLARFQLSDGIVTSSVMVFHVVDRQEVTLNSVGNEVLLLLVGFGTAAIINALYMPNVDSKLAATRHKVDELFGTIFLHLAEHLKNPAAVWDGHELLEAPEVIRSGIELAGRAAENKLFQNQDNWSPYFEMRRQHYESIQRMLDLVAQVYQTLPHGEAVARLFEDLSVDLKSEYYAGNVELALLQLEKEFKAMPLPANREEFEVRSALLQLCLELKTYLNMAKKVKKPLPLREEEQIVTTQA